MNYLKSIVGKVEWRCLELHNNFRGMEESNKCWKTIEESNLCFKPSRMITSLSNKHKNKTSSSKLEGSLYGRQWRQTDYDVKTTQPTHIDPRLSYHKHFHVDVEL